MTVLNTLIDDYRDILLNTARIFSSVFEILVCYILINSYFTPRIRTRRADYLPFVALAAAVIFLQEALGAQTWLRLAVELAALIVILFALYIGTVRTKLIASGLFILMTALSFSAGDLIHGLISKRIEFTVDSFEALVRLSVSNLFMILFACLFSIFAKKSPRYTAELPLKVALLTVPAITMITFAVFQYYIEISPPENRIVRYIYLSGAGLLFINVLVFILFGRLRNQLEIKRENDILMSQLRLQETSIVNLENSYNRTRAFRHDIKNHVLLMNMLAEQGNLEELKAYLKEMSGVIDESSYVRISGVSAVDAILNEKLYEAQAQSIRTSYDVVNLDKNGINPMDLCIILSNALDNAIEANAAIENKEDRYIKLKIHGNETFSVISVANPTVSETKKITPETAVTSKADRENHGFGLKSIESAAKKYNGEMLCKCEDGVFTIVVRLTAPGKKTREAGE